MMPIATPDISVKQELARKMFDIGLSVVPGGGALAALYSVTHPAKGEVQVSQWREELTSLVNSLEDAVAFLTSSITLSEDAASLGKWVSEQSQDGGRFDRFSYDDIITVFPHASKNEIHEAIGELELEGLVLTNGAIGRPILNLRPTSKLFEIFDPIVFPDVAPREDAATIAEELLLSERGVSASDLQEKFGWNIRRINPAMAIVGEFIAEGRKSSPMGQPYIIRSMSVDAKERATLRRFANQVSANLNSTKGGDA